MKKTTAYARKAKRIGGHYNAAAWANVITMCRPYGDDVPVVIPGLIEGTQITADKIKLKALAAFDELHAGRLSPNNEAAFDEMSIALAIGCIRAGQIAGDTLEGNPMLAVLVPGNIALRRVLNRRRTWGKWQLDPVGAADLKAALEQYEIILQASSPQEIAQAEDIQREWLNGRVLEAIN